ncbi:hypothetical protein V8G54_010079 [Vigna mungo]|uniref:Uncharacterized protein n=1 Tax=Vigna mungo TaxID=3915 RepID=A0AAQ3NXW5_VIGMU
MLETKHTFPSSQKEANMSHFCSNKSDSSSRLARSFKNSAWSMSSLMTALPESPSTICSNASATFHPNTHHATEFSTPRHHNLLIRGKMEAKKKNTRGSQHCATATLWLQNIMNCTT